MTNKMEQVIIHFLNKGYGDLIEYKTDEYPDNVYHIRGKKVYMRQDIKNGELWVDYYTIWQDLENWFSLKYKDIQSIITKWVEEIYNIRGLTSGYGIF